MGKHSQIAIMKDIKRRLRIAKEMTESSQRLAEAMQRDNDDQDEATMMAQSQRDSQQAMDLLSQHVAIAATRATPDEDQEAALRTIKDQETLEAERLEQSSALAKQLDDEETAEREKATVKHNRKEMHECKICCNSWDRTPMTYLCCGQHACWKCFTNPNAMRCP